MEANTEALAVRMIRREFSVALKLAKSMVADARSDGSFTTWDGKVISYRDGIWSI